MTGRTRRAQREGISAQKEETPPQKEETPVREISKDTQNSQPVIGREEEYSTLKHQVTHSMKYGGNACIYVTGVPGCGKTHTITTLLSTLKTSSVYLNCSSLKSKASIYQEIADRLCKTCIKERDKNKADKSTILSHKRVKRSCAPNFINGLQYLRQHILNCTEYHIIVLDEVDFLYPRHETILYNLFELTSLKSSRIIFMCISNTLGTLSTRLGSRVGSNRVDFKPYTSAQLKKIVGKAENIDDKVAELIVKRTASVTGDVRRVTAVLERAEGKSLAEVNKFITSIESNLLDRFVETLTFYHKLIIFLNRAVDKKIHAWFAEFKSFCKVKEIPELDFVQFMDCVNDLCRFGIFVRKGVNVSSEYMEEEIMNALKKDTKISTYIK